MDNAINYELTTQKFQYNHFLKCAPLNVIMDNVISGIILSLYSSFGRSHQMFNRKGNLVEVTIYFSQLDIALLKMIILLGA